MTIASPLHTCLALGLLMLTSLGPVAAQTPRTCKPQASAPPSHLEADARQAFRDQRYAAAYGRFMRLADSGNVAAADIALLMLGQGPTLFGQDWSASPPQIACWRALTINHARHSPFLVAAGKANGSDGE